MNITILQVAVLVSLIVVVGGIFFLLRKNAKIKDRENRFLKVNGKAFGGIR